MQHRERSISASSSTAWGIRGRRALVAALIASLTGTLTVAAAPSVHAAPAATAATAAAIVGRDFTAGLIISDAQFYDGAAMTEPEVQAFLVAHGSGLQSTTFSVASRAKSVSDTTGNVRCGAFTGGTRLAASTIIFRAQAACGISAKVILVTLQKEQGLILKAAPSEAALDRAMGMACPDTAPCAVASLGFGNQVYEGSRQLNTYRASRFATQPGAKAIKWHPDSACGSSVVNIQNFATAALYSYTPYQPNAAALTNLGGVGNSCSSYGNRNFWVFYNDWFGSPTALTGPEIVDVYYQTQGGASGWLGVATSPVSEIVASAGGLNRAFVGGMIYWSDATGAWAIPTALNRRYVSTGGVNSSLGWPTAAAVSDPANGGGYRQTFQGGALYWTAAGGTHSVRGNILAKYGAATGPASVLGWPTGKTTSLTANGITGKYQAFEKGTIYWTAATGAHSVRGTLLAAYGAATGPAGALGWPTGKTTAVTAHGITGKYQVFQRGTIYRTTTKADITVSGPIHLFYQSKSAYRGVLGWPTAPVTCRATGTKCSQVFQNGRITWSKTGGARIG